LAVGQIAPVDEYQIRLRPPASGLNQAAYRDARPPLVETGDHGAKRLDVRRIEGDRKPSVLGPDLADRTVEALDTLTETRPFLGALEPIDALVAVREDFAGGRPVAFGPGIDLPVEDELLGSRLVGVGGD
jgi:hypothetical protein